MAPTVTPTNAPPPNSSTGPRAEAIADQFQTSANQQVLGVLANDVFGDSPRIVSVTQPAIGSVVISGSELVIDLPPSYAGELTFTYTFTDESEVLSSAEVRVSSANVLGPVRGLADDQPGTTSVVDSIGRVASQLVGLLEVRLSALQIAVLAPAPLFLGMAWALLRRRERLMSITDVEHSYAAKLHGTHETDVRHDALVWSTGLSRRGIGGRSELFVETSMGTRGWIRADRLHDTGF